MNQLQNKSRAAARQQVPRVNGKHVREARGDESQEAIVCVSGSRRGLNLLNAALRLWELRNGVAVVVVAAVMLSAGTLNASMRQGSVSAGRMAAGEIADDESPCGPYVSEEDCASIQAENTDDWISAWLGEDVDGEAGDE